MFLEENAMGLLAALLTIITAAVWLETTWIGRRISAAALVLIGSLIASNVGFLPKTASLYDLVWTYLVPLSIALFLLKADLMRVIVEGGRVLTAFVLGAVGAALGAVFAGMMLDLGSDEAKYTAVFSATYTGGSLNFAAVSKMVDFTDATAIAGALTIDNVMGAGFIFLINVLAALRIVRRVFPWRADSLKSENVDGSGDAKNEFSLLHLVWALAIAALAVTASMIIANYFGLHRFALLFLTILVTIAATIGRKWLSKIRGEEVIALLFMYLFFAVIGAGADISSMLNSAPQLFLMVISIFAVHLIFLVGAGYFLKLNYAELVVASLACIAGPPVAAAIAIAMNWRALIVPGILTGILGYAVGNFIGVGVFMLMGGGE